MATKTLTITEDAYDALKREKNGGSFSDAILNMAKRKRKLSEFAGTMKMSEDEWSRIRKDMDNCWKGWEHEMLRF